MSSTHRFVWVPEPVTDSEEPTSPAPPIWPLQVEIPRPTRRCGLCGRFRTRNGQCTMEVRVPDSWTGWEHQ